MVHLIRLLGLVLVNVAFGERKLNQPCILSNSQAGRCVRVEECAEIAKLMDKAVLYLWETQKVKTALHICESDENSSDPIVCCGIVDPPPRRSNPIMAIASTVRSPPLPVQSTIETFVETTTAVQTAKARTSPETITLEHTTLPTNIVASSETPTDVPVITTTIDETAGTSTDIPITTTIDETAGTSTDIPISTTIFEYAETSTDMPTSTIIFEFAETSTDLPVPTIIQATTETFQHVHTPVPTKMGGSLEVSTDVPITTAIYESTEATTNPVPVTTLSSTSSTQRHDHFEDVLPVNCGIVPAFTRDDIVDNANVHSWVVLLEIDLTNNNNTERCVGTLIHERFVLIAAHCVHASRPENIKLYFGVIWMSVLAHCVADGVCQQRRVGQITVHQDYNSQARLNDVALIQLNEAVSFTSYVWPACLPIDYLFDESLQVLSLGWDATEHGTTGDSKRIKRLNVVSHDQCDAILRNWPQFNIRPISSVICTISVQQDVCFGDLGAPLLQIRNGQYYVVGVISHGPECGTDLASFSAALRISEFTHWILNNMIRMNLTRNEVLEVLEPGKNASEETQSLSNSTNNNEERNYQRESSVDGKSQSFSNIIDTINMYNGVDNLQRTTNVDEESQRPSNSRKYDIVQNNQQETNVDENTESREILINTTITQRKVNVIQKSENPSNTTNENSEQNIQRKTTEFTKPQSLLNITEDVHVYNIHRETDVTEKPQNISNSTIDGQNNHQETNIVNKTESLSNVKVTVYSHNNSEEIDLVEKSRNLTNSTNDNFMLSNQEEIKVVEKTQISTNATNNNNVQFNQTEMVIQDHSRPTIKDNVLNNSKQVLPAECGRIQIRTRVWGGIADEENIHVWSVFLDIQRSKNNGRCVGTLIHERFVLTAAHCVHTAKPENIKLYFGLVLHSALQQCLTDGVCQERQAAEIITHQDYKPHARLNDMALLRLGEPVSFTEDVQPACLFGESLANDPLVISVGWGEYEDGPVSDSKRLVPLKVIEQEKCEDQLRRWGRFDMSMTFSIMCTVGLQTGQDVCEGDSGSSLLQFRNGQYFVVGVVSFGPKCGVETDNAGVATRVLEYQNWILTNLMNK